jgi:epoxyqueuosine reductase
MSPEQPPSAIFLPVWLNHWMEINEIELWGVADLRDLVTPKDGTGQGFPFAISWVFPMDPEIISRIRNGPNQAYAEEYNKANSRINEISQALSIELRTRGFRSVPLAASARTDTVNLKGDFPHKTAATRAGLGWIGRNCQLITIPFGPWIRLGTVFTDMDLPCGTPMVEDFCGKCMRCVEACPVNALTGEKWYPGLPRESLLDAQACEQWKTTNYFMYNNGHNCGICAAVCPYGIKVLKKKFKEAPSNSKTEFP